MSELIITKHEVADCVRVCVAQDLDLAAPYEAAIDRIARRWKAEEVQAVRDDIVERGYLAWQTDREWLAPRAVATEKGYDVLEELGLDASD